MQNISHDLLDGGAEPHDLMDDAGDGPAASTTKSKVQVEPRGARSRSSHRLVGYLWGRVGWMGL
eukprot:3502569-Prymnesium_polylepis.1